MGENSRMEAITGFSIRDIVKLSNELGIKRDDIVTLTRDSNQYILVYYAKK